MSVQINQSQLDSIFKNFDRIEKSTKQVIQKATQSVWKNVRKNAEKNTDTGMMYSNIQQKVSGNEGTVWVDDSGMMVKWRGRDINYANFVHWGSRPHKIRATKKKVLSDGYKIFGKEVNHPGYKGNPFMILGLEDAKKEFREWL